MHLADFFSPLSTVMSCLTFQRWLRVFSSPGLLSILPAVIPEQPI